MKKHKKSAFKKALLYFFLLLVLIGIIILLYVRSCLIGYENGDIDNYMTSLVKDLKTSAKMGSIGKYFDLPEIKSNYEKNSSLKKGYKDLFNSSKITYKKGKENNTYNLYADDIEVATITLDDSNVVHKMGILTYVDWKIENIKANNENGLFNLDFYINSDYELYINNNKVKEEDLKESTTIKELEDAENLVELPKLNHYEINNLTYNPKIKIKDKKGKEVSFKKDGYVYTANDYETTDDLKTAQKKFKDKEFNPLDVMEKWSLFMTNHNTEQTMISYSEITEFLIKDTTVYNMAHEWATGIDTTFTSFHTYDKDIFTNEKLSNFTIYNENAFSVEVYFTKNMKLNDGQIREDVLHDICYFVYYDGEYRLIYFKTVIEE